jgi:hypothetical protein
MPISEFASVAGVVGFSPTAVVEHEWGDTDLLGLNVEPETDSAALKYTPHAGI